MQLITTLQYLNRNTNNISKQISVFKKGTKATLLVQEFKDGEIVKTEEVKTTFALVTGDGRLKNLSNTYYLFHNHPTLLTFGDKSYKDIIEVKKDYIEQDLEYFIQ